MTHRLHDQLPLVWDGTELRSARWSEAPNGYPLAVAAHMCRDHPLDPDVLIQGPVMFGYGLVRAAR